MWVIGSAKIPQYLLHGLWCFLFPISLVLLPAAGTKRSLFIEFLNNRA